MEELITPLVSQLLAQQRQDFNQRFEALRRHRPHLRPNDFLYHLRHIMLPMVEAVAKAAPNATQQVLDELYDLSLHLLAKGWLAQPTRLPELVVGWQHVLPQIPHLLAVDCRRSVMLFTNALFRLRRFRQVDTTQWLYWMGLMGPLAVSLEQWMAWGQLMAWRCGMAHYRKQVENLWQTLPASWIRCAFNISCLQPLDAVWQQLQQNPWLTPPDMLLKRPLAMTQVKQWGDFRALGGSFHHPPRVTWNGQDFEIWDGRWWYHLNADCYGITLECLGEKHSQPVSDESWQAHWQPFWGILQAASEVSSMAANSHTLIYSRTLSFKLTFMAWISGV